jgi:Plasmid encoded RepA protein
MSEVKDKRDYAAERRASLENRAFRLGQLKDDLLTGKLGDEAVQVAKVLLLCTLPFSRGTARQVSRTARLGDGSDIRVTFTAGMVGVDLPFGADARLLDWLLNRAFQSESPVVPLNSVYEYLDEIGRKSKSGKTYKELKESFLRICGLGVSIQSTSLAATKGQNFFMIRAYNVPSLMPPETNDKIVPIHFDPTITEGVMIDPIFHEELRLGRSHVAIPYELWRQLKGNLQVQAMVKFFYWRCYSAMRESVMTWEAVADQYGHSTRPRRQRDYAREAVAFLRGFWPEARIEVIDIGILFDRSKSLLPNDPSKKRVRIID